MCACFVQNRGVVESGAAVIKVLGKRSGKLCSIASTLTLNLGLCSPVGAVWCHLTGRVLSDKSCGAGNQVNACIFEDSKLFACE